VKRGWVLPLVLMAAGVVAGMLMNAYRKSGRPRDLILVRVGKLRSHLRGDPELPDAFRQHVRRSLIDTETSLSAEDWQNAKTAIKGAEDTWRKWQSWRADWLRQFAYAKQLLDQAGPNPAAEFLLEIRRLIEDAVGTAPELDSPTDLRNTLDEIGGNARRYFDAAGRLEKLNQIGSKLSGADAEACLQACQAFQQRLSAVPYEDIAQLESLQTEITEAVTTWEEKVQALERVVTAQADFPEHAVAAPPAIAPPRGADTAGADVRLELFKWASWLLAVVLLAITGFHELYLKNPVFGVSPVPDYLSVFLWGFGAEATRAAVTATIQGWDVPVPGASA
jgi:hypothetical protein